MSLNIGAQRNSLQGSSKLQFFCLFPHFGKDLPISPFPSATWIPTERKEHESEVDTWSIPNSWRRTKLHLTANLMNKALCKSVINSPLSDMIQREGCDRKHILPSQVAFNSQNLRAIAYSFTCARTSKSILPTKRAIRLISRLSSFPSSQLAWRKVVPAWAWGHFGCK